MCACRCGIRVHLKDGHIRYIEGNPDHPVNRGVLCAKGSAGIMHQMAPSKLRKPLKRVGDRGSGEFEEIEWEEALNLATDWLQSVRKSDPRKLAFFTGRDQSQALTGFWASQFGTCNYAAHGGFCSVNMAAAGLYTIGGSFWEFGEPDWENSRYLMIFGVAEDHDSNPIKLGLAEMKANGAKIVSINPIRTGYSAIADEWVGIRPGTDGLFVMSIIHELLRSGKVDAQYLARYTNAGWLVIDDPGSPNHGLFARDTDGNILCIDRHSSKTISIDEPDCTPALKGRAQLADGVDALPVFELLAKRYLSSEFAPSNVASRCGVASDTIERLAAELAHIAFSQEIVIDQPWTDWTGKRHAQMVGRPVSMHAMRGISAHSNGFHTCRAIHILQLLLGSVETPGGFRLKAPFPRPIPPGPQPAGKREQVAPSKPMSGPPLGFPRGPEDLIVNDDGSPRRIDKAFSWEAPLSVHGMMHSVISNASRGDPYEIEVLFMYMANVAWNSSMNTEETISMLTKKKENGEYSIPKFIYCDAFSSETVFYADLVLPDTTFLERYDCISLLDRPISSADAVTDSIRQPVISVDRDVRPFQDVLIDLGYRLGLPAFVDENSDPRYSGGYADYIVNHERKPGVGSLIGWRGANESEVGKGAVNKNQLDRYKSNGCFFSHDVPIEARYYKNANKSYLDFAEKLGLIDRSEPIRMQLYSEPIQKFRLSAQGHGDRQPPDRERERIMTYFDPLPIWYEPFDEAAVNPDAYPLHAITQRPMAMYHSWGSQNAWLRQLHSHNSIYIHAATAKDLAVADGDWVEISSRVGSVVAQAKLMTGVERSTIWTWNAIGKRAGAWSLTQDADESEKGFLLNHLIDELLPAQEDGYRYANADPVTGQAAWYDLRVCITKIDGPDRDAIARQSTSSAAIEADVPSEVRYGESFLEAEHS